MNCHGCKMNLKELHKQFKDDDSPSVEGQYRWLERQGFTPDQIERGIIEAYTELENGQIPTRWTRTMKTAEGKDVVEVKFGPKGKTPKGANWKGEPIKNGFELDQFIMEMARLARHNDLRMKVKGLELFEQKLRAKWSKQVPWYKRVFGVKPSVEEDIA